MGTISEHSYWEPEIYSLETNDLIAGGVDGVDNKPHWELANRTLYLKDKLEALTVEVGNNLQEQLKTLSESISRGDEELTVNAAELTARVDALEDSMSTGDAELASQVQQLHMLDDSLLDRINSLETKHNEIFDSTGKLAIEALPEVIQHNRGSYPNEASFPATGNDGDFATNIETNTVWFWNETSGKWENSDTSSNVNTVNGKSGDVVLDIDDIGNLRTTLDSLTATVSAVPGHTTQLTALTSSVSANASSINSLKSSVNTNTNSINSLKSSVNTNTSVINTLKTTSTNTNNNVTTLSNAAMPLGSVIMFSGSFSGRYPIPLGSNKANTNWVLCDGTKTNGYNVPDLRNRMIVGSGSSYKTGNTGGSATHNHSVSGNIGWTTLSVNQMPSHNHYMTAGGQSVYASFDTGHYAWPSNYQANTAHYTGYTGGNGSHSHSLTINNTSTANNLPPYYALAFIMRVK